MKTNAFLVRNLLASVLCALAGCGLNEARAQLLTWNNGAGNMSWDTTSTNWGGTVTTWNNSLPNGAVFGATAIGTVTLTTGITAGSITFNNAGYTVAGNTLTLGGSNPGITNNAAATISATLAGTQGFTKAGASALTLSGANSISGQITDSAGTITLGNAGALGSSAVVVNGGAVLAANGYNIGNSVTLTGRGRLSSTAGSTVSSPITLGAGGGDLAGGNNYAYFKGQISGGTPGTTSLTITAGHVNLANSANNFAGNIGITNYYLLVTNTGVVPPAAVINIGSGGGMKLENSGTTLTIGGLNSSGCFGVFADVGAPTLVIGYGDVSSSFGGATSFNLGQAGAGVTLSVVKIGAGTFTLTGAANYTGATTVSNGTMQVNSPGSLNAGSTVTVMSTATLAGNGRVNGPVTVQSGGTLAGGTAAALGTLTCSSTVSLNPGSTTALRISKTGGLLANDTVSGFGTMNYGGTLSVTDITSDGTLYAAGDVLYLFPTGSGSYNGSFVQTTLPTLPAGLAWDTSLLPVNGSIQVINAGSLPKPLFSLAGGGLHRSANRDPELSDLPGRYYLLHDRREHAHHQFPPVFRPHYCALEYDIDPPGDRPCNGSQRQRGGQRHLRY